MSDIFSTITAIPAITVLCLLLAQGYKGLVPEPAYKHIPTVCGALGLALGILCYLWIPGYLPAENAVSAAAIGAVSGWAATGANQAVKQYSDGGK